MRQIGKSPVIVINAPGTVTRLPIHTGALHAWFDNDLPIPDVVTATSGGVPAISACAPWTKKGFLRAEEVIGELTPKHVWRTPTRFKRDVGLMVGASCALAAVALLSDKMSMKQRILSVGAALLGVFASEGYAGYDLFTAPALADRSPLYNLLMNTYDFQGIFNSKIRINILATELHEKRAAWFSNYDDDNRDHNNPLHRDRYVLKCLASMSMSGWWPPVEIEGHEYFDGEYWTDFPIKNLTKDAGDDGRIIRFDYWTPLQPEEPRPLAWSGYLDRSAQIARDKGTEFRMAAPQWTKQFQRVCCVRASERLHKRIVHLPLHSFSSDDAKRNIETGYMIVEENLPEIRHYLRTGEVPEENGF